MTCIVAQVVEDKVHMAGDKLGSDSYTKHIVTKSKVFINNDFIIGYTTSFRMGQLLEFTWSPPEKLTNQSEESYIYKTVIDSIKETLSVDGFGSDKEVGTILLGYKGKLYKMQSDYSIFEEGSCAIGCGEDEAKAVLYTLDKIENDLTIEERLALAIEASSVTKTGVSVEYNYLYL